MRSVDTLWFGVLPMAAYAGFPGDRRGVGDRPGVTRPRLAAFASVVLLVAALHNSWDDDADHR